jgi:hypothetical protein
LPRFVLFLSLTFASMAFSGCATPAEATPDEPLVEGLYVFELTVEDQVELDAAAAALALDPDDEDLRAAFNRVYGRTWRALRVTSERMVVVGEGRMLPVSEEQVLIEHVTQDVVRLEFVDEDRVVRATRSVEAL